MSRRDWTDLAIVIVALGCMLAFRAVYVEPRTWGDVCGAGVRPAACAPRAALLWLQHWHLWGAGALTLGFWAFLGGPRAIRVAAVALGAVAVANYNATWGMLGLALGVWAWIGQSGQPEAAVR